MDIKVRLFCLSEWRPSQFEELTDIIFSNLNINDLELLYVEPQLITTEFYDKIKQCKSLRRVKFINITDVDSQLDVIESNSNIQKAYVQLHRSHITHNVKERVRKLLSRRNDNSFFIVDDDVFEDIPLISQIFNISPISYD